MQETSHKLENHVISWSEEELNEWKNANLIPIELLSPLKKNELASFISQKKSILHSCFKSSLKEEKKSSASKGYDENSDDTIKVFNKEDLYEFHVVDKRTGEVVKILEKTAPFQLCEGISLEIKTKEWAEWEEETAIVKTLSKQQHAILKTGLEKIGKEKELTRKEIVTLIEEIIKPRKAKKVRQAGHFTDVKLQCNYPEETSLFDLISPETKEKISSSSVEVKAVGIKLTPAEDKLINVIYKLLHDKSEIHNEKSELFYGGNEPGQLVPYGGEDKTARSAFLRIKPTELYEEYLAENDYSGKEITNIKNILRGLSEKKFLIVYNRRRKIKNGNKIENRTDRIEEFQNLIKIVSYIEGMTDAEVTQLESGEKSIRERKGELIIALNPLLTDQVNSKYVEYPTDINQRTMIASGGHAYVTESINALRDYMLRELSNKRYNCELNADKLPYILRLDNYIKSHRKKLINERINGAIKAVRNLGLILDVELQEGALGQLKYVFSLNPDFE